MAHNVIDNEELQEALKLFMESLGRLGAYNRVEGIIEHVKELTLLTEALADHYDKLLKEIREENKCKKLH